MADAALAPKQRALAHHSSFYAPLFAMSRYDASSSKKEDRGMLQRLLLALTEKALILSPANHPFSFFAASEAGISTYSGDASLSDKR